jgi:hypothetical protein
LLIGQQAQARQDRAQQLAGPALLGQCSLKIRGRNQAALKEQIT